LKQDTLKANISERQGIFTDENVNEEGFLNAPMDHFSQTGNCQNF